MKGFKFFVSFFVLFFEFSFCFPGNHEIDISSAFPGGNIKVDSMKADTVWLRPEQRDTDTSLGKWFYWYFAVKPNNEKSVTFVFNQDDVFAAFNPAVSYDQGKTWEWLAFVDVEDRAFTYHFNGDQDELRFSMAMPYTERNYERFLTPFQQRSFLYSDTLCITNENRDVELLRIIDKNTRPQYTIVFTARHHACEMMANYVMEGIIQAVIKEYQSHKWVRQNVQFLFIPFVDKDGVENGDQGKLREPHDHNRDYYGKSLYEEVSAIKEKLPVYSQGTQLMAFDLHCPYIAYEANERIFFIGHSLEKISRKQRSYMKILDQHQEGPLKFDPSFYAAFGKGWNNYTLEQAYENKKLSFTQWIVSLDNLSFVTTLEFPYSNNLGQKITPEKARLFGKDMFVALKDYLLNHNN